MDGKKGTKGTDGIEGIDDIDDIDDRPAVGSQPDPTPPSSLEAPQEAIGGSCLCGEIRWRAPRPLRSVLECHCVRCQKMTGNYMAATACETNALVVDGDSLTWYSPDDDPNVAYGFCSCCGSTLFWRCGIADGTGTTTSICAGSIDGSSGLRTAEVWHAENAADHVRLDPEVPQRQTEA